MKTSCSHLGRSLLLATLLIPFTADAQTANVWKLHAHNTAPQTSPEFGRSAAMNESWILIGEPGNDDVHHDSGVVHVFNPATGAFVRKIACPNPTDGARFGEALALSGDLALIGAPGVSGVGEAYLFNVKTGVLVRTFAAPQDSAYFGSAVALDGAVAAIGDPKAMTAKGTSGVIHALLDVTNLAAKMLELLPLDIQDGDQWGSSVALNGTLLLAGAPAQNTNAGAAYLFNVNGKAQLRKWDGFAGDKFGSAVALAGGCAFIGAPFSDFQGTDSGVVRQIAIANGGLMMELVPYAGNNANAGSAIAAWHTQIVVGIPGGSSGGVVNSGRAGVYSNAGDQALYPLYASDRGQGDAFGTAVAVWGNRVLVTAVGDDDLGSNAGAAYLYTSVPLKMELPPLAVTSSLAPGLMDVKHSKLNESYSSVMGRALFTTTLSGSGLPGGTGTGVFSTDADLMPSLSLSTGRDLAAAGLPGLKASAFSLLNAQHGTRMYFTAKVAGSGVSTANDYVLFADDGTSVSPVIREGATIPLIGGAVLNGWTQVSVSAGNPVVLNAQLKTGVAGVTSSTDSAVLKLDNAGVVQGKVREGDSAPTGTPFGTFTRVNVAGDTLFHATLQASSATNAGVFDLNPVNMTTTKLVVKGDPAPGIAGAVFSTFLGENYAGPFLYLRATVSGGGVTSSNNDGVWSNRSGSLALVARTGTQVDGMDAGIKWTKFYGCWPTASQAVVLYGAISGPGVSSANDTVLWVSQEDATSLVLLREGDVVEGIAPFKIGTIQRVAVDQSLSDYAVLASLTGAPSDRNQVLLTGSLSKAPLSMAALRKPFVRMQKGALYDRQQGVVSKLTSINWSGSSTEPISQIGYSRVMNAGRLALQLSYSNGTNEIVWGVP